MALPAWFGPVAQGAGDLFGSIISNIGQSRRQKKAFRHDQAMAQQAYGHDVDMWNRQSQWNLDMWNLQNEYNLPANMMQRLRDAGLNPNLVATQGGAGGTAASVQPATSPKYQQVRANYDFPPIDVPNILGMYQNFRLQNAQIDNVKESTDLLKERQLSEQINRTLTAVNRGLKRQDFTRRQELEPYFKDFAKLQLEKSRQEVTNMMLDERIKRPMVGRTEAEAGLRQMEYQFFRNLGIKGMRDIAPFLQLLLQSFRRR